MNGPSNKINRPASSPAAAGFRPAGAALAIAAAFLSTTDRAHAQPSGAQAIHGQASLSQQGSKLVVTTQNGAGSNHSAINWQSFSVPGGSTTHFQQPGTTSLSINRVVGSDPSSIFGTLSSNGRLVLVNPAGIAVGAGAVVDTAGFTASTLRMSDANALAGRLVFGGDGLASGALEVNGQILARSGDVVLIAPNVQVGSQALVQSPNGATMLAAGQKVELTGRGLEGIRLELQAPGDQALNLGTLQGDAVGIFAGQLKHSGLIQATGISVEGGKVVLKGVDTADIAGRVTATQGDKGGQVHATANKVMLRSGAVIDVSGAQGGGEALIGGGWQGKDTRISNAVETLVEAGATIKADAIASGNGGTIVAWSDGATRVYGALSARGGAASGDGGNIETSGHYLDMQGQVDTRAPNGKVGNLLLDPTNVFIANDLTNANNAGMTGSNQTSTGPVFVPSGVVQDSLVTVSALQTFLGGANVTVRTDNASGTGAGFIRVVDGLTWTSGSQLSLMADNSIMVDAPISGGAGSALGLRAFSGNITQGPGGSITVPNLFAYADAGSVTLTNSGNTVSTLSGYATTTPGFSFVNSGALSIGSVSTVAGAGNGIRTNNQSIQVKTLSGELTIADTNYGTDAGSGNVTLEASTGSVTQAAGAKITGTTLTVTASNSINLSIGTNDVQSFFASQTGSTGGAISFVNNPTGQWTLGNVTQSALSPSSVSISSATNEDIRVQGIVQSGASSSLSLSTAGSIVQAGGLLKSNTISLQAAPLTSGLVGTSTTPLETASNATSTTFNIGATAGPTGVYINHAGNAVLNSINPNPNAPFQFKASSDLNVSSINSGSSTMLLGAGGTLNVTGNLSAGGGITLEANRMNLSGAAGSINAGGSVLWVKPKDANWKVDLGSTLDTTAGTLELSTNELNVFAGTGALRVGSLTSGDMDITAAIAPSYAGTLTLESGGIIRQTAAGTITKTSLAVRALGDVDLDTATNSVTNIAAALSDPSDNSHFRFKTSGALTVAGNLDGTSGIFIQSDAVNYDSTAQNAYIRLEAGGAVNQQIGLGALLGGKAVYVQGTSVQLTEPNPTGVISGTATGTAATDVFKYTSSNGINVNDVAGGSGVHNDSSTALVAVELTGTNISQKASSFITAANGLKLVAGGGAVMLNETGNDVGSLSISGASTVNYQDATALTIGLAGLGVSASGAVDIRSAGALTVMADVTGAGVVLKATGAGQDLNINATVDTGSGSGDLRAANDILLNNATLNGSGITTLTAGNAAKVTAGTSTLNTDLAGSTLDVQGTLVIGAPVIVDSLSLVAGGTITGGGDLTVGSNLFWSGGSMTGTGDTVIASGATASITGAVLLTRPLINASGGSIILSGSGQINAMSPGFLDNMGVFDIQNDGGFTGSAFTINNSGMFGKTAGTGVSMLSGVNFTNTGTLGVASGTLQFDSAGFSSNSGWVGIAPGAILDNSNTTLANTSAGVIGGSGTLRLGTGTLNNSGTLKPGGPGVVGTLTIDAATVNLDAGTYIYADIVDTANYDRLYVTGGVNLANGVTVVPDTTAATGLLPGNSFDILQSSLGSVGGALPVTPGFDVTFETSPAPALRLAVAALPPAPAPVFSSDSTPGQIAEIIGGTLADGEKIFNEMNAQILATEEEEKQAEESQGQDNVVDNNQCLR